MSVAAWTKWKHDDIPQNLFGQLRIVILVRENLQELCHGLREVFEVG